MNQQPGSVGTLFLTFLKIGAFTFGGGYAMIPLIQNEVVEKRKWMTDQDILDIIAIAESTPGPISINAATFVGYKKPRASGGRCLCTMGVVLPLFLMIATISLILQAFAHNQVVQYAFAGIRAGVLAPSSARLWCPCTGSAPERVLLLSGRGGLCGHGDVPGECSAGHPSCAAAGLLHAAVWRRKLG